MTGEQPPADDAAPSAPDIRVSHADRDEVVDLLQQAAGDGRLTADELDERVEAALNARTGSDLAVLTADLPAPAAVSASLAVPPKDLVKIDQRFGDIERTGRWVVPKRMELKASYGDVKLDFTEAVITADRLELEVDLGFGTDLTLITKPGVLVLADDLTVRMGDVKVRDPHADSGAPVTFTVDLTGRVRGGGITVRGPRRTPRQWLRREKPV